MPYAIRKDGQGWRSVDGPSDVGPDENFSSTEPVLSVSENALIVQQIADLETTVTDRRIREAVLGIDGGWLKGLDDQISALRSRLK